MKIRALKTTTGLPRGCVAEVDDHTARELIAQGYAIEELPPEKQEAINDNGPFGIARTGSLTGADALQSLLLGVQAPVELISPLLVVAPDLTGARLDISPSTTDTNSALGQTPSTPATPTGGKRKRGRPRSRR